ACDRTRRRGPARGQFVSHFSRGDAQPDRRTAAVQEGRLYHGAEGAGTGRPGGDQRREGRDAQGESDHSSCADYRALRAADRNGRDGARRSRRARRAGARRRCRASGGSRGVIVDSLATLGRTLGFSFAAGINLYATVAILGLASRYGWVALPPQYQAFDNNWI